MPNQPYAQVNDKGMRQHLANHESNAASVAIQKSIFKTHEPSQQNVGPNSPITSATNKHDAYITKALRDLFERLGRQKIAQKHPLMLLSIARLITLNYEPTTILQQTEIKPKFDALLTIVKTSKAAHQKLIDQSLKNLQEYVVGCCANESLNSLIAHLDD